MPSNRFVRTYALDDIAIRSGGDGRTVEAYAAVFDSPTDISDRYGEYSEVIAPAAFDRTLAQRGTRFSVFFNHGLTLYGTPSERGSMPIGTPVEVRADARGLWTVTRYNSTPLADEALEAIKTGAITGQSFHGRFVKSDTPTPRGGFRAAADGSLTVVTRTEIALVEYGPTPMPAYEDAAIVGVRQACACGDRGTTIEIQVDGGGEPPDCSCDCEACRAAHPETSDAGDAGDRIALPEDDPRGAHSSRLQINRNLTRLRARERGLL